MTFHSPIPASELSAFNAAAASFNRKPDLFGIEWRNLVAAIGDLAGNGFAADYLAELDSDLGLTEVQCLACGQAGCGCDAAFGDERSYPSLRSATGLWL